MKIALSVPGFSNVDVGNPSLTPLPKGVPTGGLITAQYIVSALIEIGIIIAIFYSLFTIIRGGINMSTSGGDKQKFQQGRERIRYAIIGLIFIFVSFFMVNFLGDIFGIKLLSFPIKTP